MWKNEKFAFSSKIFRENTSQLTVVVKVLNNFTQLLRKNGDSTLWKLKKSNLTEKKIRQINYLVISSVKMLLSRNFCQQRNRVNVESKFPHFAQFAP